MLTWLAPLKAIQLNVFTTNEKQNVLNTSIFKVVGFVFCFLFATLLDFCGGTCWNPMPWWIQNKKQLVAYWCLASERG